jgi:hypothetical protein
LRRKVPRLTRSRDRESGRKRKSPLTKHMQRHRERGRCAAGTGSEGEKRNGPSQKTCKDTGRGGMRSRDRE